MYITSTKVTIISTIVFILLLFMKVQLKVYISESLDDELRRLIAIKYKKFKRGLLSMEVEKAIKYWILSSHTSSTNSPKYYKVWARILKILKEEFGFTPERISYRDLERVIIKVRGSDERTIRKWINVFIKEGLIRHTRGPVFEITNKRPS